MVTTLKICKLYSCACQQWLRHSKYVKFIAVHVNNCYELKICKIYSCAYQQWLRHSKYVKFIAVHVNNGYDTQNKYNL